MRFRITRAGERLRPLHTLAVVATAGAIAIAAAGCGSSSNDGSGSGSSGSGTSTATNAANTSSSSSGSLTTVRIGIVPSLQTSGLLSIGTKEGFFKQEGLQVQVTPVDSGPEIIAGLAAGQYDIGATAYAPMFLAIAAGQKLKLIANTDNLGPAGTNGVVVVNKSSGITSFAQLAGKSLASNAARSQLVLEAQAAISKAGGDGNKISVVQLPFNEIAGKVAAGQVTAGSLLQPYEAAALAKDKNLVSLGDPATRAFPAGTPQGGFVSTTSTATSKAATISKFEQAFAEAVAYGNTHPAVERSLGATADDIPAAAAALIPLVKVTSSIPSAAAFKPLVDAMVQFGWLKSAPDLSGFLGQ